MNLPVIEVIMTIVMVLDFSFRLKRFGTHLYLKSPQRLTVPQLMRIRSWAVDSSSFLNIAFLVLGFGVVAFVFFQMTWWTCTGLTIASLIVTLYTNRYARIWSEVYKL